MSTHQTLMNKLGSCYKTKVKRSLEESETSHKSWRSINFDENKMIFEDNPQQLENFVEGRETDLEISFSELIPTIDFPPTNQDKIKSNIDEYSEFTDD